MGGQIYLLTFYLELIHTPTHIEHSHNTFYLTHNTEPLTHKLYISHSPTQN